MHIEQQDLTKHSQDVWLRRALYAIGGCFVVRLIVAAIVPLDLVHDEAYYWEWARRLDVCYYSKPPMVAWLIAASTSLFGDTTFAVRLPAIVLGTWGTAFVLLLARDMYGSKAGFWATLLALASPGGAALGLIMTIDAPLLFCWSAALYAFWQLLKRDRTRLRWLVCVTIAIGLGVLSKQTMLAFLLLAGLFLLVSREDRIELRRPALWICALVSLCFLTPVLWWNVQHGWVTLEHTSGHFAAEQVTLLKRSTRFLEFVGSQFGVVSPVTCWLVVSAGFTGVCSFRTCDRRTKFLLAFSVVPLLGACLLAMKQRVEPNWGAPAYIAGVILAVGAVVQSRARVIEAKGSDRRLPIAFGTGLAATMVAYLLGFGLGLEGSKLDPAVRLRGWEELGVEVGHAFAELPDPGQSLLVVTNGRAYASELAFYMPQHPEAFLWNPTGVVGTQYDVWGGPRESEGRTAMIVTPGPTVPEDLAACFEHVKPLREVVVKISDSRKLTVHLWHGVALDQAMADEQIGFGSHGRQRYANVAMRLRAAR
ncbi:MAG TPA: glycosyltransferase family 39 protein [Pirellulaceae bacterium]|nr:glycosyltransferase family 39 protein [Pirellulaceae bacterium]